MPYSTKDGFNDLALKGIFFKAPECTRVDLTKVPYRRVHPREDGLVIIGSIVYDSTNIFIIRDGTLPNFQPREEITDSLGDTYCIRNAQPHDTKSGLLVLDLQPVSK